MSVSIAVKVFIVVLVTLSIWSLIRKTMMKSIHPYFDSNDIEHEDEEIEYGESLESLKTILDETYVSVIKILDESESAKSVIELEKGLKHLKEAIKQRNVLANEDPGRLPKIEKTKKELKDPGEICPEKYKGAKHDYPLYLNNIPLDPTCKVPPLNSLVTVTFNFVNEIPASQAEELFEDAAFGMYKDMTFLAYLKKDAKEIPKLKEIAKAKLPNMHVVEQQEAAQSHADVLEEMAKNVKTKYVVLTRNTERFDNFSTIIRLVRDISLGKAEIVAGSHRNTSGHWRAGCYQMKQRLGEMALDEGYDFSDNGCMFCDYVSGPFGIKNEVLLKYLESVKESPLKTYQFYMEMFFNFRLQMKKKIMMCIDSMFYTVTSGLLPLDKAAWLPYLKRNKISKIVFPRKVITHETTCKEVGLQCVPDKEKNLPFCCYREIEEVLSVVSKFLQENKIQYHFCLPDDKTVWKKLYMENPARNVILIRVSSLSSLSSLKLEGFSWSYSDYEFSSDQWKIVFQEETSFPSEMVKIRFNKLLLQVDQNPGKALAKYGKTACTRDKICFDLLHFHGPLDAQKVWI